MKRPSFSIIVPTYQRRGLVCETVRALSGIKYQGDVEVLVVVDGSTDGTAAALKKLDCRFPLRVVEQPNRGAGAARNLGARKARGEILLFLDDDMICEPDIVDQHARSYRSGADAVIGDFTEPAAPSGFLSQVLAKRGDGTLTPFDMFSGQISMRREAFEAVGGFDESFAGNGDWGDFDVGLRLLRDFVVVHNPMAVSHHRGVLTPRAHVRRARTCAAATVRFAAKHPELRSQLIEWTGAARISRKVRLLCKVPVIPPLAAKLTALIAEAALHTPLRSSATLSYLRQAGYTLAYWSTMEREGGL